MKAGRTAAEQFGRMALTYARRELGRYPSELVELARPSPGDRYLDVGTGPGTLARLLSPRVSLTVGTDLTGEMLRLYVEAVPTARAVQADALSLPFAEASFSLVTNGSVLHHLDDPERSLAEVARVLSPGGRFLLIDMAGPEDPERRSARDKVERVRDPSHVGILPPSRVRAMLEKTGFELREEERQAEEKSDEDWVRLAGGDLRSVRQALAAHESLKAGFVALWRHGEGFVFRRERAYYLAVKRT
ncbi:MAG TPA: methyltransferase domain-containing protein [Actinomycetota bacterium]|jgi:ubiquinone/menaquinone biosynthesis C-methylase UbiE|nr:methyltransferase domain-containing protein [Actinomycetota bacterium]